MNKIRISNLLIFIFVLASCFLLCGCTIRTKDGKLVIYNEKKQAKILNDIIDNLDDLTVIKEHYDYKCFFDGKQSGTFDEEFTKYTNNYYSVVFRGEYRDNPEDKNAEPTKLVDVLQYYYYDGKQFIVAYFEDGKYVSTHRVNDFDSFDDEEEDVLPESMSGDDDAWQADIELFKAEKGEVYFDFVESLETTYKINGTEFDCYVDGEYRIYIKESHITKIDSHVIVSFSRNPLSNLPYSEYTKGIEIEGEAIFEYNNDKSYDDILKLFEKEKVTKAIVNFNGYIGNSLAAFGVVCDVTNVGEYLYEAKGTKQIENNFNIANDFKIIVDYFEDINSASQPEYNKTFMFRDASVEIDDSIYMENGAYKTNNKYLNVDVEFTIILSNDDCEVINIKIRIY